MQITLSDYTHLCYEIIYSAAHFLFNSQHLIKSVVFFTSHITSHHITLHYIIEVKNVFYVFYFKIKNAFFNVFIFPTFFIDKKRWKIHNKVNKVH